MMRDIDSDAALYSIRLLHREINAATQRMVEATAWMECSRCQSVRSKTARCLLLTPGGARAALPSSGDAGCLSHQLSVRSVPQRLQIDLDILRARNPRIIYARGHAYGSRGPDAESGGYDATAFWMRGGVGRSFTASLQSRRSSAPPLEMRSWE